MYIQVIKNIKKLNNLKDADLARLAHVSRATVCQWYHQVNPEGWTNVETANLITLAQSLKIPAEVFLEKHRLLSKYQTQFLWDFLYPDMETFVMALIEERGPALARLVQILGFYEAKKILGKKVLALFTRYKKYIKPVRRRQLEILWPLYNSQISNPRKKSLHVPCREPCAVP